MRKDVESIVTDDLKHCYIHKKYLNVEVDAVHIHHMCHGSANRKLADKHKIICGLCERCHSLLHDHNYHDLDLQQDAERAWLLHNKATIKDWISVFGKNYL